MKKIVVILYALCLSCVLFAETNTADLAKTECSKLQNTYMSMKRDYLALKKATDNHGFGDLNHELKYKKDLEKQKALESKLTALPATTPEAKLLQKKLLKQLQLGRDLTKDELAALEKEKK